MDMVGWRAFPEVRFQFPFFLLAGWVPSSLREFSEGRGVGFNYPYGRGSISFHSPPKGAVMRPLEWAHEGNVWFLFLGPLPSVAPLPQCSATSSLDQFPRQVGGQLRKALTQRVIPILY